MLWLSFFFIIYAQAPRISANLSYTGMERQHFIYDIINNHNQFNIDEQT